MPLSVVAMALLTTIATAATRHPHVDSLNPNSREIFATAMEWGDRYFDAASSLTEAPPSAVGDQHGSGNHLLTKESAWYALGLLLRDATGDRSRAAGVIRAILKQQYDEPAMAWDGTFRRNPQEPEPKADSRPGIEYDPNWREFIGTAFAIILKEYPDRVHADLAAVMRAAITHAVSGEMKEGRLKPNYTNIALMYGFLWNFAATDCGHPEWAKPASDWQESVYALFKRHDSFEEYNSPTYTGVDLYALALYRDYGTTARMRSIGSEMEAELWHTTAAFYNANLRNISGPFDRAYGMDMESYVSVVGLWLRTVMDQQRAPLPSFTPPVDHVGDLWIVPALVVLDANIPDDAMREFTHFEGEHAVTKTITEERTATAWIGKDLMYGAEATSMTKGVEEHSQFHPVTIHWKMPDGKIGWVQLTRCPPIDATAKQGRIDISTSGDVRFRIFDGSRAGDVSRNNWSLPGLHVKVETDAASFDLVHDGAFTDVTYHHVTKMLLLPVYAGAKRSVAFNESGAALIVRDPDGNQIVLQARQAAE
jgi:hypothetical protein